MSSATWTSAPQDSSDYRYVTISQGDQPVIQWQTDYTGSLLSRKGERCLLTGIESLNMDVPSLASAKVTTIHALTEYLSQSRY